MNHTELSKELLELFNNDLADCLRWMNNPHRLLGGLSPLDKIQEDGDTDAVMTVLAQIRDGAYV